MPQTFVNAVYYPSWEVYKGKPPSSLQTRIITHIFYAFVGVNADGTIKLFDEWADLNKDVDDEKGGLAALAKLKHAIPGVKTLVSLGGGSGSAEFPKLAASAPARERLAREIREFCDRYCMDGIDIDWEHPKTPDQGRDYIRLLEAVRSTLPSSQYLLTSALPVGEYCLKNIDVAAASPFLDFINLMGYDFNGGWTKLSGHHAQLFHPVSSTGHAYPTSGISSSKAVDYLIGRDFPSNKILLGVPAYARHFSGATGPGQPFTNAGEMDYSDIPDEWIENAQVDESLAAASCVDAVGDKGFISFDVPSTVRTKGRYAKTMALGGLFYWTGPGDRGGRRSLVAAGYDELASSS